MLLLVSAAALCAQTAGSAVFRAIMLPSNEVPPVAIEASGVATIRAHFVRDASGQITSGSVDFDITYNFPESDITFTGLHIHRGAAGVNGNVVIDTGISASNSLPTEGGRGTISRQAQVVGDNADRLAALRELLTNPAGYYVNLHSTVNPGGVIRGQLQRAEEISLFGVMSTANEVPPIEGLNATGLGYINAIRSFDETGAVASGIVTFDISYTFPSAATFTGLHIHRGAAGVNGNVIINTGISGGSPVQADPSGSGRLTFPVEVDVRNANQLETLNGLFFNPAGYYVNLHTTVNPGGAIRAQLRRTDRTRFPVLMSPANEVPPITDLQAQGVGFVDVDAIRGGANNAIQAARVTFDVNHRFPSRTEFTGFHIHNGGAGTNGNVTVNTGIAGTAPVVSETGFGNITRGVTVSSGAALDTLNSMMTTPQNHYVNLHTTVHGGGAVRVQAGTAVTGAPTVAAAVSSVFDPTRTTLAPNALFTIVGTNLARATTMTAANEDGAFPTSLNGVAVTIGGRPATMTYVSPDVINAVVPADLAAGSHGVIVTTADGSSPARNVTVESTAPAIFFFASGGAVTKADYSLVTAQNAAAAGDLLVIWVTGLGQTTPPLETGKPAPASPLATAGPVTVTIGGQNAEVLYPNSMAIAVPGSLGVYVIAVRMPSGVAAGTAALVVRQGSATSNSVNIATR